MHDCGMRVHFLSAFNCVQSFVTVTNTDKNSCIKYCDVLGRECLDWFGNLYVEMTIHVSGCLTLNRAV